MDSPRKLRAQETTAFNTLLMGIFINSPLIDNRLLNGITKEDLYMQYGQPFYDGLLTFGRLSGAEQIYLIHYLQR